MANTPIDMNKLRRVLKLHFLGKNKLQITASTGLSRNTVRKYLALQRDLAITWSDVLLKSDKELDDLFCVKPAEPEGERLAVLREYFVRHDRRLAQRGMTLRRHYDTYAALHPDGYRKTAFYRHYYQWKRRVAVSMHIVHKAGDRMYVDFTGEKLSYCDADTGQILTAEVFVAILGASQLTYVEATPSQRVEDFIGCCQRSLHFFGGAPNAIVPDNLKSAVIKSNRYEPQLNENFEGFADHYSMAALPARAYKPKDKALVEGAVKIIYTTIFASMPRHPPPSLEALNDAIWELLKKHNSDHFKGRTYSRMDQFIEMEQQALQPLPEQLYELRHSVQATALKNGHVCLSPDKHFYSVPRIASTIPHPVQGEAAAGVVLLKPASPGTGVIAGGPVRAVLECAGIHDVLSKSLGSSNPINIVHATMQALKDLVRPEEIAARRGLPLEDVAPAAMLRARAGQGV